MQKKIYGTAQYKLDTHMHKTRVHFSNVLLEAHVLLEWVLVITCKRICTPINLLARHTLNSSTHAFVVLIRNKRENMPFKRCNVNY